VSDHSRRRGRPRDGTAAINYARENDMIIITKDTEFRKASEENDFPLILLDDEEILKVIVEKLKKL
jgi:rRNA-processing protein FCF1